jgi:hypothetical protein
VSSQNGPYSLGSGSWNSQSTAWGNSGNVPGDQPPGSNNELTQPFWDAQLQKGLDPSNSNLSAWDIVFIGGKQLPGTCKVSGKRGRRIDIKQAKGTHYATLTFNGYDPARISIAISIWTQAQYDVLDGLMSMLEAPPHFYVDKSVAGGKVFQALDISHPSMRLMGVSQVLVESIDPLHPTSVKGVWEMGVHVIEYKVVKTSATSTVQGSQNYSTPAVITGQGPLLTPGNDANQLAPPFAVP